VPAGVVRSAAGAVREATPSCAVAMVISRLQAPPHRWTQAAWEPGT
jgi:hypothetical protein